MSQLETDLIRLRNPYTKLTPEIQIQSAIALLDSYGVAPLHWNDLMTTSRDYSRDLLNGLLPETESSLKMHPTELEPVDFSKLEAGDEALVIEIGGTKVRAARVVVDENHKLAIAKSGEYASYIEDKLSRIKFESPDEFLSEVIGKLTPVIQGATPKVVGFIYSFPGKAVRDGQSVDVIPDQELTKEFAVAGIGNQPIGQLLMSKLSDFNIRDIPYAVLNDTPAVLLAHPGAKIGGVVGTGFNLAVTFDGKIYSTESGGFAHVPQHPIDQFIDFFFSQGKSLAEKQISGKYLGHTLGHMLHELIDADLLTPFLIDDVYHAEAEMISQIEDNNFLPIEDIISNTLKDATLDTPSRAILRILSNRLRERSARLVGMMMGTYVNTARSRNPDELPAGEIDVPVEGSVFWDMPGYKEIVQTAAGKYCNSDLNFISIEHAGIIGAAAAALNQLTRPVSVFES